LRRFNSISTANHPTAQLKYCARAANNRLVSLQESFINDHQALGGLPVQLFHLMKITARARALGVALS